MSGASNSKENVGSGDPVGLAGLGATVALAIGWIDTSLGLTVDFTTWGADVFARSCALTTGFVWLTFVVAWLITRPIVRFTRLSPVGSTLGLALGAIGLHLGIAGVRLVENWSTPSELLWTLPPGLLFAAVGLRVGSRLERGAGGLGTLCVVAWLAAAVSAGALAIYHGTLLGASSAWRMIALSAPALCLLPFTAVGVLRWNPSWLSRVAIPVALVMCALPLLVRGDEPSLGPKGPLPDGAPRTVILMVVDTLRADHLGYMAEDAPPTPNIDAIAAQSIVFRGARSPASWTLPSMCTILTGVAPDVHRAVEVGRSLPREIPTLAEGMDAAGYATAAFGQNVFIQPHSRLFRGFDVYDTYPKTLASVPLGRVLLNRFSPDDLITELPAPELDRLALDWLGERPDQPAFMWLHYFDVHQPYTPNQKHYPKSKAPPGPARAGAQFNAIRAGYFVPDFEQREWIHELYRAEIRQFDEEVGHLVARLKELGRYDDALIIFASDHGEEFWEHGGYEHGHTVYDELMKVPLLIKLPGQRDQRNVVETVGLEAITPTIFTLCGIDFDAEKLSAPSLLESSGQLRGFGADETVLGLGNLYYEDRSAVWFRSLKLIRHQMTGTVELYDLAADPAELVPLTPGDVGKDLGLRLQGHRHREVKRGEALGVEAPATQRLDEATLQELRSLGYVE